MSNDQAARPGAQRKPADVVAALRGRAMRSSASTRQKALGLVNILAEVRDASTRQRRALRLYLPEDMREDTAARVLSALERPGAALPELYEIFKGYIDQCVETERLRFTACTRCTPLRPGIIGIPGIGWLCREHFEGIEH